MIDVKCVDCGSNELRDLPISTNLDSEVRDFLVCQKCGKHHFYNKKGELM